MNIESFSPQKSTKAEVKVQEPRLTSQQQQPQSSYSNASSPQKGPTLYQMTIGNLSVNQTMQQHHRNKSFPKISLSNQRREPHPNANMKLLGLTTYVDGGQTNGQKQPPEPAPKILPQKSVILMNQNGSQSCKNPQAANLATSVSVVSLKESSQECNKFTSLSKVKKKKSESIKLPASARKSQVKNEKETTTSTTYPALQSFLSDHQEGYDHAPYQHNSTLIGKQPAKQQFDIKPAGFQTIQPHQKKQTTENPEDLATPIMKKLQQNIDYASFDKRNKFYQESNPLHTGTQRKLRAPQPNNDFLQQIMHAQKTPMDGGITPDNMNNNNREIVVSKQIRPGFKPPVVQVTDQQKRSSSLKLEQSLNPFSAALTKKQMPLSKDQSEIKDLINAIENSYDQEQRMQLLKVLHDKVKAIQANLQTDSQKKQEQLQAPWPQINTQCIDASITANGDVMPVKKKVGQDNNAAWVRSPPSLSTKISQEEKVLWEKRSSFANRELFKQVPLRASINPPTTTGTPSITDQPAGYTTSCTEPVKAKINGSFLLPEAGRQNMSHQTAFLAKQKAEYFTQQNSMQPSPEPDHLRKPEISALKSRKLLPNVSSQPPGPTTSRTQDRKKSADFPENDITRIYKELEDKLKLVEPTAPDQMRDKFLKSIMTGPQHSLATSAANRRSASHLEDLAQIITMFGDFLFLTDCHSLGIIPPECNEQAILKELGESGQQPPRLTFEAHKILRFASIYEGIKVDTLIVEVPLFIFQQTMIEPMFVLFGNKLLENLSDKVPASKVIQKDSQFDVNFPTVASQATTGTSYSASQIDFPTIEDTMTVYSRLKQYGLLRKMKNKNGSTVKKKNSDVNLDKEKPGSTLDIKQTNDSLIKTRNSAGGGCNVSKKPSQQLNLPSLKNTFNIRVMDKGSPSSLETKMQHNVQILEQSGSELNPFTTPKGSHQVSGVSMNSLRHSQKFKKMMKHNWDRIFTSIGVQGNPLAKAFRFGCIVKHSELYDQLKLAYNTEQDQVKTILANDLESDYEPDEELHPIVRTVDTSILNLITFVNNIGLLRCTELLKHEEATPEKLVLTAIPNIRQIALVVRENAKRTYEPIQRNANGSLLTSEMKEKMGQARQFSYRKESADCALTKFNKSPSFQQIQQIGMPNSMVPNGLNQRNAFFRHLSVIHALQSTPLVNHTNALQTNLLGRQMMDSLTITPAQQSFKRLFEIAELERLNTQLLATHMRTIKRQCSIFKPRVTEPEPQPQTQDEKTPKEGQSSPINRKSIIGAQQAQPKQVKPTPQKVPEAADLTKEKRMQTIHEKLEIQKGKVKDDDTPKIKIVHKAYTHLQNHPVNRMLRTYNDFIMLTFRTKDFNRDIDIPFFSKLQGLAKKIGLNLPPRRFLTMECFKSGSRQAMQFKEILWYYMTNILNEQNNIPLYLVMKDPVALAKALESSDKKYSVQEEKCGLTPPPLYASAASRQVPGTDGFFSSSQHFNTSNDKGKHQNEEKKTTDIQTPITAAPFQSLYFRYKIGKGNNSTLIRTIMKNRSWWYASESSTFASTNENEGSEDKGYFGDINFLWTEWRRAKFVDQLKTRQEFNRIPEGSATGSLWFQSIYNRLEHNFHLSNKKCLFYNMKMYYYAMRQNPFDALPLTFHCEKGADVEDPAFQEFLTMYQDCEKDAAAATLELKECIQERKRAQAERRQKRREERKKKQAEAKKANKGTEQKYAKGGKRRMGKKSYAEDDWDGSYEEEEYYDECDEFRDVDFTLPKERELAGRTKNIWILKPGENSNRGHGINVAQGLKEVKSLMHDYKRQGQTVIIQKYIANPLLIHKRKFDIRVFTLVTSHFGCMKAYFYKEGYLRTSCKEYSLNNLHSRMVHLTNDAVQQNSEDYGRYEPGNKLGYSDFQKYLNTAYKDLCVDFERDIVPQIQKLVTDTIRATFNKIDKTRRINSFEIFGYDFMIDDNFKLYIIECNTNPCLELSAPLLGKLLPQMLDNAFRIAIDPLFMPSKGFTAKKGSVGADTCPENRFELIFDEVVDGPKLMNAFETAGMKSNEAQFNVSDEEDENDEQDDANPQQEK